MKHLLLLAITLLAVNFASVDCTRVSPSHGLFITPDNVRHHASFIHSSVTVEQRVIHVRAGTGGEKLIEVPLASAGELNPHATVRITVGLDPTAANAGVDSDPSIGITDGENINDFYIVDINNLRIGEPPCRPVGGTHQNIALSNKRVPGSVTFLFDPFHRYGACSTGNDGGYTSVATFNNQLDVSKGISFILRRNDAPENYRLYHFLIEILE